MLQGVNMTINKYWIKPKKRYNRTYKKSLTIRNKKIRDRRILMYMLAWFVFIATYAFIDTSHSFNISPDFVEEKSEARSMVEQESVAVINPVIVSLPAKVETKMYKISAYSEYDSCHYPKIVNGVRKCLTASGKIAEEGMIATNLYPFGTKIIIGGREFTVEDRISRTYNNRLDIFMGYGEKGYDKAINWGLKTLEVKKLEE